MIDYKNNNGLMTIKVPTGSHKINLLFGENTIEIISDGISLVALFALFGFVIISRRKATE
jgi:hypothetical protein